MDIQTKFNKYAEILREWNGKINLVAPGTLANLETRHIADSAQLADILPKNANIVDMGSGAGFPAVVLAILGWNVTAIESVGKKAIFLKLLKTELDLPNLTIFHGRVEDYIRGLKLPGVFDKKVQKDRENDIIFTARAFAPLIKILDYVYNTNSRLFLLKGREIESEISVAKQKYKFDYKLIPSKTGDGFIIVISQ